MDHGKRDVSRWPIATGTYYKKDYSEGVDISRYKNIPVPTSLMAAKSNYDFVGGYDYGKEAGILHVADHHVSPGKKQWTWGCGDFGRAWDRHATCLPDPYYLEGLKRDPSDIRINNAYGMLLFRRGRADLAEPYFRTAIRRLTRRNPNPYNSESYYDLGLCLFFLGRDEEAYDAFFKAAWSAEQQNMSFYYLACIDMKAGRFEHALSMIERSLVCNTRNIKARALKAVALRKAGYAEEEKQWLRENLEIDPFDYVSGYEAEKYSQDMSSGKKGAESISGTADSGAAGSGSADSGAAGSDGILSRAELDRRDRRDEFNLLRAARDFAEMGCWEEALEVLKDAPQENPLTLYYEAYDLGRLGREDEALAKIGEAEKALKALTRAFDLDRTDSRVFFELDQLHKKTGWTFEQRLQDYREHMEDVLARDDLAVEYATLLNAAGHPLEAYDFIMNRRFHPWEGGEGKVTTQYEFALLQQALQNMAEGKWKEAGEQLRKALVYPVNLGEGKLEGTKDNHIHYYLGICQEKLGETEAAAEEFETATKGTDEPAGMMYYNDQPADMILYQGLSFLKLQEKGNANRRFYRLIDYGERHIRDHVKIGYFAVSLPDFLTFEDNLDVRNQAHCLFLMAMGHAGLGNRRKASEFLEEAVRKDPSNFRMHLMKEIMQKTGLVK